MSRCKFQLNNTTREEYQEYCNAKLLPIQMFRHEGVDYCKNHILNVRVDVSSNLPRTEVLKK